ncbi:RNA polymerase sigma factor [Streptomyces aureocirculatus]|uniref:RNA polymerase sigma factor n=2 Tax=Streptomyces aureocirculatus TaxID=67275 RepID=UPI0004C9D458|nr:sigma-70 family RNA polymerase sigma factor [Streptomyces aureocirculatus]
MSDDAPQDGPAWEEGAGMSQSMYSPLDLPIDFEAFYLGHQEAFHGYAEAHFGTRAAAEEVIHKVFLEILAGWTDLLSTGNLEQGAWAIVRRAVHDRLELEGRLPAFIVNGPITQALAATRDRIQAMESSSGLYEAIGELQGRQFEVIVLRFILGYPTVKVAWYMGIDDRTVDHHIRRAKERLRTKLQIPQDRKRKGEQ